MSGPRTLTVLQPGPLTTVQDLGRPGRGALGIGRSGACDRASAARVNRLVGNDPAAAVLELTLGGLALRADVDVEVVTSGARCPGAPHDAPSLLRAGQLLRLGTPATGAVHTLDKDVQRLATKAWDECLRTGVKNGWRNAQASVLAPNWHDRFHDGLRHHGYRARLLASASSLI